VRLHSDDVDGYPVGEVASLAHVTVRTLHHYDAIGLLTPGGRTAAGYRRYTAENLQRLQQILYYRALGFGLDQITEMLAEPGSTADDHLRRQHKLLREQIEHRRELLAAIEKEMAGRQMGIALTPEEQFEIFGTDKVTGEWHDEAAARWAETPQFQESQRRAATYTKDDWAAMKVESDSGLRAYADAMRSGVPATSPQAMALAEDNRQFIVRWFYDCDYAMHRCLAEMYVADERFRTTYDTVAPGLAQYVHDAISANAAAHGD
jgi:DNA-binding transcriptional MerR regulator